MKATPESMYRHNSKFKVSAPSFQKDDMVSLNFLSENDQTMIPSKFKAEKAEN